VNTTGAASAPDEGPMATEQVTGARPPRVPVYNDPKVRSVVYQIVLAALVALLVYGAVSNAADHLRKAHIASGFGFWNRTAGFDISQTLISYTSSGSTYGRAFWVGLLNTLLVAGLGVVLATILGFVIGIGRLSTNWIVARAATGYVETIRNIPLLLQLLFWYNAVLKALPDIRDSWVFAGGIYLNNRGLIVPRPQALPGFLWVEIAFAACILATIALLLWARRRQMHTGRQLPVGWFGVGLIVGLPLVTLLVTGVPLHFGMPQAGRFNITGGIDLQPEFVALLLGLTIYTAGFIAEVVRAGILAVARGQAEAAYSLGLTPGPTLRLIVIPQAMRVIVPPLTNQYLNLIKNSSLAVAIGYPDLVQIFTGTVLNQTGQAVEVVAITMLVYLTISLVTSFAMNLYNRRVALVER
jgi:general L-amino acid transport system permease protein